MGTGERNMREISPKKVVTFFFQESYPFASQEPRENED